MCDLPAPIILKNKCVRTVANFFLKKRAALKRWKIILESGKGVFDMKIRSFLNGRAHIPMLQLYKQ